MAKLKQPPIDWLKAVILERMAVSDFTLADVALLAGIGVNRFGQIMKKPVPFWDADDRRRVLKALGIKVIDLPAEVKQKIAEFDI